VLFGFSTELSTGYICFSPVDNSVENTEFITPPARAGFCFCFFKTFYPPIVNFWGGMPPRMMWAGYKKGAVDSPRNCFFLGVPRRLRRTPQKKISLLKKIASTTSPFFLFSLKICPTAFSGWHPTPKGYAKDIYGTNNFIHVLFSSGSDIHAFYVLFVCFL